MPSTRTDPVGISFGRRSCGWEPDDDGTRARVAALHLVAELQRDRDRSSARAARGERHGQGCSRGATGPRARERSRLPAGRRTPAEPDLRCTHRARRLRRSNPAPSKTRLGDHGSDRDATAGSNVRCHRRGGLAVRGGEASPSLRAERVLLLLDDEHRSAHRAARARGDIEARDVGERRLTADAPRSMAARLVLAWKYSRLPVRITSFV